VLAAPFTRSDAQLVVAREAGFASWPDLRHHVERWQLGVDGDLEAVFSAAIAGDAATVRAALALRPGLAMQAISRSASHPSGFASLARRRRSGSVSRTRPPSFSRRRLFSSLRYAIVRSW